MNSSLQKAADVLGPIAQLNAPLGVLTTYRVGGNAAILVEPGDINDLLAVAKAHQASQLPVMAIGRGSNMLVADAGFEGICVVIGDAFSGVERDDVEPTIVIAGGGASLPVVARHTVKWKLTGFEWAVGVPGSIGGAVRMNAGGHGSDMAAVLLDAVIVDLQRGDIETRSSFEFGYRSSNIAPSEIVVSARLQLRPGNMAEGEVTLSEIVSWRRANQPGGQNCGSVFTNPPGDSAGRLVDAAGLRGHRIGTAQISDKHCNFIQADPGGSANDVREVIDFARAVVFEKFSIDLHPEVRLVGFDGRQ